MSKEFDNFNKREIPTIFVKGDEFGVWSARSMYIMARNTTLIGVEFFSVKSNKVPAINNKDLFNRV